MGELVFGWEPRHHFDTPNRDFLSEYCTEHHLMVPTTLEFTLAQQKVTFMETVSTPTTTPIADKLAMLDLVLVP